MDRGCFFHKIGMRLIFSQPQRPFKLFQPDSRFLDHSIPVQHSFEKVITLQ